MPAGRGVSEAHGGQHPLPLRRDRGVLGVLGTLQGEVVSPVLTWTNHSTAWGVEASPVGRGAVLGGHTHVVLKPKTLHHLPVSSLACSLPTCPPPSDLSAHLAGALPQTPRTLLPNISLFPLPSIGETHTIRCRGRGEGHRPPISGRKDRLRLQDTRLNCQIHEINKV